MGIKTYQYELGVTTFVEPLSGLILGKAEIVKETDEKDLLELYIIKFDIPNDYTGIQIIKFLINLRSVVLIHGTVEESLKTFWSKIGASYITSNRFVLFPTNFQDFLNKSPEI